MTTFVHLRELNTIFIELCFRVSIGGRLVSKVVIAEGKTFEKYTQWLEMSEPFIQLPHTIPFFSAPLLPNKTAGV